MNKHSQRVCFVIWKVEGGTDKISFDGNDVQEKPPVAAPAARPMRAVPQTSAVAPSSIVEYSNSLRASEPAQQAAADGDALGLLAILATHNFSDMDESPTEVKVVDAARSGSVQLPPTWEAAGESGNLRAVPAYAMPEPGARTDRTARERERERVARLKVIDAATTVSRIRTGQTWAQDHKMTENQQKLSAIRAKDVLTTRNDESILRALKGFPTSTVQVMAGYELEGVYRDWRNQEAARRKELRGMKRMQSYMQNANAAVGDDGDFRLGFPAVADKRKYKKKVLPNAVDNYGGMLLSSMSQFEPTPIGTDTNTIELIENY